LVRDLATLTAIASVSKQPDQVEATADELTQRLRALGMDVEDVSAEGPPLLLASGGAFQPKKPDVTLVLYAHYDGQNVDPSRWTPTTPFEPKLYPGVYEPGMEARPLDDEEIAAHWRLYARAASDDKGPIAVVLEVLEGIVEEDLGPTTVGLKLLLDGEEESGDPNLGASLTAHADAIKGDAFISLDGPVFQTGDPTVVFGVRGIASIDLTVYGANGDLHSGHYGNWAGNPAQELAAVLSTLKDPYTGEVQVDGFYGCRRDLSPLEAEALDEIPDVDDQVRAGLGVVRAETQYSLKKAITYPSLNVRGFRSGDVGSAARTVIPSTAEAAIDIRLVPDCEKAEMVELLNAHLRGLGYEVIAKDPTAAQRQGHERLIKLVARKGGYRGVRTSMDWELSTKLVEAVERGTAQRVIRIPNMGGSLPFFHVEDKLDMRVLGLPLVNHDNNQHGPNENVRVGNLWRGFDTIAAVLLTYGVEG
jgi:acetylornithine deacetylase/succinyl-diaminopimelate desuccinylase-like protein